MKNKHNIKKVLLKKKISQQHGLFLLIINQFLKELLKNNKTPKLNNQRPTTM